MSDSHVTKIDIAEDGMTATASCTCEWSVTKTIGDSYNGQVMTIPSQVATAARAAAAWHRLLYAARRK